MEELIYDIGFHKGEDTLFYLLKGYNVVAVDADIELIEEGKSSFKEYIDNGRLILLNYAITNESDKDINFFISQNTLLQTEQKQKPPLLFPTIHNRHPMYADILPSHFCR